MNHGTFQAKYVPLSKVKEVEKIYIIRKYQGPDIDKVEYIILPKILRASVLNLLITPFLLTFYAFKKKADIVLTYHLVPHAFFGYFASLLTGKPHIFCQTGGESELLAKKKVISILIKHILIKTKYMNVPGNESKDFWINNGIDKNKINVLHSTIDTYRFIPSNYQVQEPEFIYIGRLINYKNVDKIIKSFGEIYNLNNKVRLRIIGNGPEINNLKNLCNQLKLNRNVVFEGHQKNVIKYLSGAKIFVMFSDSEGLPVALMEAMSMESLCIAPKINNIPSVLKDFETGFLLEPGNYKMLFEKMEYALNNYHRLDSLRKKAREIIVKNYSYESAISTWYTILNNIR